MSNQEFLESNTIWSVLLEDGTNLNQSLIFSWKDLKKKINKKIRNICLSFRDNKLVIMEENPEGFYLVDGFSGDIYSSMMKTKIVGVIKKDICYIREVKVPELIILRTEQRPVSKCIQDAIIWNDLDKRVFSDIISV